MSRQALDPNALNPFSKSLHVTLSFEGAAQDALRVVAPTSDEASFVIPLAHKPVSREGQTWNATLIALGHAEPLRAAAVRLLDAGHAGLKRVALMDPQPGIDMLLAKENGAAIEKRMLHYIEYVTSKPETRADYYVCQYDTSAPAMRAMWDAGRVGRFVGFEDPETLYLAPGLTDWDVIHVIGMTPWQMVRLLPTVKAAFDRASKKAGRGSAKELFARWDEQRDIIKLMAKQIAL
ncbi:MAG: hypothetical protein AAF559_11690 [Pseudomonadota bacterium]